MYEVINLNIDLIDYRYKIYWSVFKYRKNGNTGHFYNIN